MCIFQSSAYTKVHIFAIREKEFWGDGWIRLTTPGGEGMEVHLGTDLYRQICLPLKPEQVYQIEKDNLKIVQIYLSGCPGQMEQGVEFLDPEEGTHVELGSWYDTPWREQYHFAPFVNWVNDPNGLCWYQGYYHVFYQANPFGQEWGDIYWGHAVSRDLIHWVHQPHVLEPQPGLWHKKDRKGGAFSGSAIVEEKGIHLFLTRHDGPLEDGEDTQEWQVHAMCEDGLSVVQEKVLFAKKPEGVSWDFRDPKAEWVDGELFMVLGAALDGVPSILLYHQCQNKEWEYIGPLLQERTPGIRTFECPDFFFADGSYVAVGAWMCHYDPEGRYQMTRCYVGSFDGKQLLTKREQWFDFGSNFYAVQSFSHEGRRIAIGWISDFMGEHKEQKNGAYGSLSLPREVHVKDGRVYLTPVKECYGLLGETVFEAKNITAVERLEIPGNSYYVRISLEKEADFTLLLAQEEKDTLTLECKNGVTGLVSKKKEVEGVRFPSDARQVREIEVFVDRRVTEVFLNHGEAAGTKVFYQDSRDGCFSAEVLEGRIREIKICQMKSIWRG